jgi:hypothetical protein
VEQPRVPSLVYRIHGREVFCLTSKMSHDGIWRAACLVTIRTTQFRFETNEVARGVTDVGVGSGALLGGLGAPWRRGPESRVK